MNNLPTYDIKVTEHFKKQLKALVKKNTKLKHDLKCCLGTFDKNKEINIGGGVFKIRIKGNHAGKSGGYRLYIYVMEVDKIISPVCIYSKNHTNSIKLKELNMHLAIVLEQLDQMLNE